MAPAGSLTRSRARATAAATRAPRSSPWPAPSPAPDDGQRLEPARLGVGLVPGEPVGGQQRPLGDGLGRRGRVEVGGRGGQQGGGGPGVPPRRPHEGGGRPAQRLGRRPCPARRRRRRRPWPRRRPGTASASPDLALEAPLGQEAQVELGAGAVGRRAPGEDGDADAPASAGTSSARVKVIGDVAIGRGHRGHRGSVLRDGCWRGGRGRAWPSCQRAMVHSRSDRRFR